MTETPKPERPADDEPSGAAAEMQEDDGSSGSEDFDEDPSRNPDDEELEDIKGG
jgi:hypothetical protein